MRHEPNYMGYDGFIWWMGVVEDRHDPLKLGRCRVRIAGSHTPDKTLIPTNELPWAHPMMPLTDSSMLMFKEGDYVIGFYLDGPNAQHPVMMGILPGIPDQKLPADKGFADPRTSSELSSAPKPPKELKFDGKPGEPITIVENPAADRNPTHLNEPTISRLTRNDGGVQTTIIDAKKSLILKSIPTAGGGTFSEPDSAYAAKYPYNRVIESESGHVIEIDDTPTKERIHIYHRSGTSIEIGPDATYISRVNSDKYDVVLSDNNIFVGGDCNLTVSRNINMKSGGDLNIEVEKSVNIKAGKGINMQAGSSLSMQSQGPAVLQAQESLILFAGATAFLQGSTSQIQSGIPAPIPGKLLGELGEPLKLNPTIATVSGVVPPPPPVPLPLPQTINMEEPGNADLAARPGTKLDTTKPPDQYTPPVESPENLPTPTVIADPPANTVSKVLATGDVLVRAMNRAKLQDPIQRAEIWAQCVAESGRKFTAKTENMMYTRDNLLKIWPSYFDEKTVDNYVPKKIGDQGQAWAQRVYGGRMGNDYTTDGYTYRGRGLIQITGKANYKAASLAFKQDFVKYPDAMLDPDLSADVAVWFFTGKAPGKKGPYTGDYANVLSVTKYVNGCINEKTCRANANLTGRAQYFEEAKTRPEVTTYNAALI